MKLTTHLGSGRQVGTWQADAGLPRNISDPVRMAIQSLFLDP